ncbi:efflux RND transporter periplasmic adaptor subunit [Acanthopleuribacter pedis]|uniref:Efflux RND transporter periplasmic adaptor subunit n=1 Tax=Acanthopleuribacter pedis TaxID=442870 RepID=A0A8J7QHU7_9BACT|nr:efflux RND transporter periplasmic adaptor subunit [Acanthopleuribacter pedis]MBO1320555.1 efflux RND transporter periplasmic adaptor subunit [Acanthopleuribacter pedis]
MTEPHTNTGVNASNPKETGGPAWKKWAVFIATGLFCATVLLFVFFQEPEQTAPDEKKGVDVGLPVSVRTVAPGGYPATITALGEVTPLWQSTLRSQVNGRIVTLSARLQPGNTVRAGELLVKLEDSAYRQQLRETKSRVAQAHVTLKAEEREAVAARQNWKRSGLEGEPDSDLVLRQPQVAAARAELAAAEAAVAAAEEQLAQTEIRAPYDGLIVSREVNPGASLFAGDPVVHLAGLDVFEVAVQLDAKQWAMLPDDWRETPVSLVDPEVGTRHAAFAVRESRRLAGETRLRTLFVHIEEPFAQAQPLLPGSFVRAELTGKTLEHVLRVPESAYTKQGLCWYVDEGNRLRAWQAEARFFGDGTVFVTPPEDAVNDLRLAVSPHAGFTRGLAVQPLEGE